MNLELEQKMNTIMKEKKRLEGRNKHYFSEKKVLSNEIKCLYISAQNVELEMKS
jgi:hypothetical protein